MSSNVTFVNNYTVDDFARLNVHSFALPPDIRIISDSISSITFKINEEQLKQEGFYILTQNHPHFTKFYVTEAWVMDNENLLQPFRYFVGAITHDIDEALIQGTLSGATAVPVKLDLADFDGLTGLGGKYKVLYVIMNFINSKVVSSE
jgi:hypothetical protein